MSALPFHDCAHLRGHWVNEREGVFRCTGCGLTQWLPALEPLPGRQVMAEPRTRLPQVALAAPAGQVQCRSCLDMIDAYTARDWGYRCPECARVQARQSECVERGWSDLDANDEGEA